MTRFIAWGCATYACIFMLMVVSPQRTECVSQDDAIVDLLDRFHEAASVADGDRYFAALAYDAVFLGTDGTERWTKQQFRAFCEPYFGEGRGWTYVPTERHVGLDPSGAFAWFDELLHNEKYGQCRGSGVVVKRDGRWQIAQYNLSMPVPNELATGVVEMICSDEFTPTTIYVVRHAERADDGTENDPSLSESGRDRAQHLARMLAEVDLDAVYSTDYTRTRQTVGPSANALQLDVMMYESAAALAERVRTDLAGKAVLVAGHSNTVGSIVEALGVREPPILNESDYGDVFIVTIDAAGRAAMQRLKMD